MNLEKVLPPGVNGKVSGHLTVKVDEVFWTRSSPGDVYVELLWWGEQNSTTFRPEDITQKEILKKNESSVKYTIKTSPGLFETYLRNCGKLTFTVLRGQNKNVIIGAAEVQDIHTIISEKTQSSYYPIFSPKGVRLGDLHISFDLSFVLKQSHYVPKSKSSDSVGHPKDVRRRQPSSKSSTATSQDDKLLSEILQKGNELRKAMMMSVLKDLPVNKIDTLLNDRRDEEFVIKRPRVRTEEPKLVDFLLGKDMTVEEEKQALETLRCTSPEDNLLNLAQPVIESKVTKSVCCLHGANCDKKKNVVQKPDSASSGAAPSTLSSSKDQSTEVGHVEKKTDELPPQPEKNYNCYRLIVKTLNLTNDGVRKIYYAPVLSEIEEPKHKRVHHPPGTTFTLEITLPSKGPYSRTLKFNTKDYKDKSVYFGQGSSHRLCGSVSWSRVKTQVADATFTVFWRHLNQRVPCPLGSARLDTIDPRPEADSIPLSLPLYSNTRMLTGHLQLTVKLGTISRGGGEAMFRLKEKMDTDNPPVTEEQHVTNEQLEYDGMSSEFSAQPASASAQQSNSNEIVSSEDELLETPPRQLDDELVRAINLLNLKPDNGDNKLRPLHVKVPKSENPTKKEACVQTTLPLTNTECSGCHHTGSSHEKRNRQQGVAPQGNSQNLNSMPSPPQKLGRNEDIFHAPSAPESTNLENAPSSSSVPQSSIPCAMRSLPAYDDYCHPTKYCHDSDLRERLRVAPREYNGSEKIHEYSVKIEKVVGVPLFTGDNDLDCYVDYSFPKVDENGIMTFDRVNLATQVRIALRETEFGTVAKHRLRLSCKLTRALLTLPSHEIIFNLWGRLYQPSPQDYRLGKATMPLSKLSSLELKYDQQRQQQPMSETFVLPIVPLESPLTSGYKGPFGELHLTIGYSNASGLSYREWRCKSKDDHYWCRSHLCNNSNKMAYTEPNYECVKTQTTSSQTGDYSNPRRAGDYLDQQNNITRFDADEPVYNSKEKFTRGESYDNKRNHNAGDILRTRDFKEPIYDNKGRHIVGEIIHENRRAHHEPVYDKKGNHNIGEPILDNKRTYNVGESIYDIKRLPNADDPIYGSKTAHYSDIKSFNTNRSRKDHNENDHYFRQGTDYDPLNTVKDGILNTDKYFQGNNYTEYVTESQYVTGGSKGALNDNMPSNTYRNRAVNLKERMQPIGGSIDPGSYTSSKRNLSFNNNELTESDVDFLVSGKRENIVKRVLKNIKERKQREKMLADSLQKSKQNETDVKNCESSDAFSNFNLGVDLPQNDDASDFEVRSQYSFLKNSVVESSFPANNCIDLESSSSSTSARQRPFDGDTLNPFNNQTAISLGSDSSLFKPSEKTIDNNDNDPLFNKLKENELRKLATSKNEKKQSAKQVSHEEQENSQSSDETLKSVESLKSFKEVVRSESNRGYTASDNEKNTVLHKPLNKSKYFKARVEICRALGLPSLEVKQQDGKISLVKPTSHAYFTAFVNNKEVTLHTQVVDKQSNPVWDASWEVFLPVELLKQSDRELEIFVDLTGEGDEAPQRTSDISINWPIVLRTGVDLTPITAGLEHASGWYSLSDRALMSRAQLKVIITPLEDVSGFREEWLKEYTKSKRKRVDHPLPDKSSSLAASLQEKLQELEKLTERMKNKMAARSQWDESSPLSLLSEVDKVSLGLPGLPSDVLSGLREREEAKSSKQDFVPEGHTEESAIVISDDSEDDSADKGSYEVVNTYTVKEGSAKDKSSENEDSLETSSQAIDRIISKVRKNQ